MPSGTRGFDQAARLGQHMPVVPVFGYLVDTGVVKSSGGGQSTINETPLCFGNHHLLCSISFSFKSELLYNPSIFYQSTDQLCTRSRNSISTLQLSLCSITFHFLSFPSLWQTDNMASTVASTFTKVLVAAVAVSSVGVALATDAPAPAPLGVSAATGLLPTAMATSLIVAIFGYVAARL
ncbi:hypothetical protein Mapa_011838 [Marchantia paleacea]|nr:hypothetical protein Mapa_011838 [Marchantia paleacea]